MEARFFFTAVIMVLGLALFGQGPAGQSPELKPPVKLEAGGRPIDVEVGHAAPLWADFDGDGLKDLLVGQFGGGKLRIYKNVGTSAEPRFTDFQWFKAGGTTGTVPTG
jgi:hypothetical protein